MDEALSQAAADPQAPLPPGCVTLPPGGHGNRSTGPTESPFPVMFRCSHGRRASPLFPSSLRLAFAHPRSRSVTLRQQPERGFLADPEGLPVPKCRPARHRQGTGRFQLGCERGSGLLLPGVRGRPASGSPGERRRGPGRPASGSRSSCARPRRECGAREQRFRSSGESTFVAREARYIRTVSFGETRRGVAKA